MNRNPCIYPGCRRTFKCEPGEPPGFEVVCGKHWKLVPKKLRDRHRALARRWRRVERLFARERRKGPQGPVGVPVFSQRMFVVDSQIRRLAGANWVAIRTLLTAPPEKPVGLDAFLEEIGL